MFSRTVFSGIRVRLEAGRHSACECSHCITNQGKAWKASAQCQLLRLAVEGFPSPRTGVLSRDLSLSSRALWLVLCLSVGGSPLKVQGLISLLINLAACGGPRISYLIGASLAWPCACSLLL